MDEGRRLTAVELQAEYLEMALAHFSSRSIDPITKDVLVKWEHALECLRRDPMELDTKVDWVMKKAMIEGFMERKSLDWSSPQVEMLDLQYHDLRPDKGLYYLLERQGRADRIVSDEEITAAIHQPPTDTRAYFRGECLKKYGSAVFGVNWDSISFGVDGEPIKRILMAEPLKGTKAHVDELLVSSPTAADLVKNLRA
jgi:proteasome accessory factor A